jgi:hypothetical protein
LAESKNAFQSFGQVLECIISEEINCFLEDFFLEKKMPLLQTLLRNHFIPIKKESYFSLGKERFSFFQKRGKVILPAAVLF